MADGRAPPPDAKVDAAFKEWCQGRVAIKVQDMLENIGKVGEGGYGEVFKAKIRPTGQICAVKKLLRNHEKEGFPITSIREIKLLREINSPNVVNVLDIYTSSDTENVFVLFEYMEHDLDGLMHSTQLPLHHVKCYIKQMLEGLQCLHSKRMMHRDLKPSNILLNNKGGLKICDFGFARYCRSSKHDSLYTPVVVTMWYRAPEVLLGYPDYGTQVDMWSAGCILFEMCAKGKVLFNGKDEVSQLSKIYDVCGTPDEANCPQLSAFPHFASMQPAQPLPRCLYEKCRRNGLTGDAGDLCERLLAYDLSRRETATQALRHEYFRVAPLPERPENMPSYEDKHKWVFRSKKKKEAAEKAQHDKAMAQGMKRKGAAEKAQHDKEVAQGIKAQSIKPNESEAAIKARKSLGATKPHQVRDLKYEGQDLKRSQSDLGPRVAATSRPTTTTTTTMDYSQHRSVSTGGSTTTTRIAYSEVQRSVEDVARSQSLPTTGDPKGILHQLDKLPPDMKFLTANILKLSSDPSNEPPTKKRMT